MTNAPASVLVVDDDAANASLIRDLLADSGYQSSVAFSAEEALRLAEACEFEAVVTDLRMPGSSGFDLIQRLRQRDPFVAIVAVTAFGTADMGVRALHAGAGAFLRKPFRASELDERVREVLQRRAVRLRNARLRSEVDWLRGKSSGPGGGETG